MKLNNSFYLIPQNEIEVKQKMTFEPELLLNLKSIVYELISIIYVIKKKDNVKKKKELKLKKRMIGCKELTKI